MSHPPTRPLPTASDRPMDKGPARFVDAAKGDDQNDGSQAKPWKTLQHAAAQLKPGDTLYLRGGIYYEHVTVTSSGTRREADHHPLVSQELAILDGGLREFFENPATAWEPCPAGVPGEFRSVKTYPDEEHVLGNFGDSMVPLHGYRARSGPARREHGLGHQEKVGAEEGVYCGPGVFYDAKTGRIHCRLAHTNDEGPGRGQLPRRDRSAQDAARARRRPTWGAFDRSRRRAPAVAGPGGARGMTAAVEWRIRAAIEFDGVTVYGGSRTFVVRDTPGCGWSTPPAGASPRPGPFAAI